MNRIFCSNYARDSSHKSSVTANIDEGSNTTDLRGQELASLQRKAHAQWFETPIGQVYQAPFSIR